MSANFRQNIIRFTWTWISLLLFVGIISLFSIWSMNRAYHSASQQSIALSELNNILLSARIDFKIQVQEWKNILLRGKDIKDRKHYEQLFKLQIEKVEQNLHSASEKCNHLQLFMQCENIKDVLQQHRALAQKYDDQLSRSNFNDYNEIHLVDQNVRGIDRQLDNQMDKLSEEFSQLQSLQSIQIRQSLDSRYENLRKFILIVMSIVMAITILSLYRLLRNIRQ